MLIILRKDTAARWATVNPVLAQGEAGYATDTGVFKIGDGVTGWNTLPAVAGAGAATAAAGLPAQLGYQAWNTPVWGLNSASLASPVAGTLYTQRVPIPVDMTVSNITMQVVNAGVGLTAGQCFACLYNAAGTLLATTGDQSGVWNGAGVKDMAITPQLLRAADGWCDVAWFQNFATSAARFLAGTSGQPAVNGRLSAPNSLFASADTGLTTAPPGTRGAKTAVTHSPWVALW